MFDLSNYIRQMFHPEMLTDFNISWIECLLSPVRAVFYWFNSSRAENLYKMNHNGQVWYLRSALNDVFDTEERRITITDIESWDFVYFYPEVDEKPVLFDTVLFAQERYIHGHGGFVVNVPEAVGVDAEGFKRMHAIVKFYKLIGMKYIIPNIYE